MIIQLFISIKKSDVYNVGMFVFKHQSLSCLLNCSATVARKIIRCLKSFDCLQVNNVSLYLIQSVVALVRKKEYFRCLL